jgi:hypothetical protein
MDENRQGDLASSCPLTARDAYELLALLMTSAELCTVEPGYYGSFRLLDAALRLMDAMLTNSSDRWLQGYLAQLRVNTNNASPSLWSNERERYVTALRTASAEIADELKRRFMPT